jgi:hypothetical protein
MLLWFQALYNFSIWHRCWEPGIEMTFLVACRGGLQSIIESDGFVTLMQERPHRAQGFLVQCVSGNGGTAE